MTGSLTFDKDFALNSVGEATGRPTKQAARLRAPPFTDALWTLRLKIDVSLLNGYLLDEGFSLDQ